MSNKKFILEDADHFITLNQDGGIVIETIFEKNFDGDLKLLLSCIEDNIVDGSIDEGDADMIGWSVAFDDYRAAMEEREGE